MQKASRQGTRFGKHTSKTLRRGGITNAQFERDLIHKRLMSIKKSIKERLNPATMEAKENLNEQNKALRKRTLKSNTDQLAQLCAAENRVEKNDVTPV